MCLITGHDTIKSDTLPSWLQAANLYKWVSFRKGKKLARQLDHVKVQDYHLTNFLYMTLT